MMNKLNEIEHIWISVLLFLVSLLCWVITRDPWAGKLTEMFAVAVLTLFRTDYLKRTEPAKIDI